MTGTWKTWNEAEDSSTDPEAGPPAADATAAETATAAGMGAETETGIATGTGSVPFAEPRRHFLRTVTRRILGICFLLLVSAIVFPVAVVAVVFTLLTAPWRSRLGRFRRVLAVAVVYAALEISGLVVAAWRWLRYRLDHDALRDRRDRVRSLDRALRALRETAQRFGGLDIALVTARVEPAEPVEPGEDEAPEAPEIGPPLLPSGPVIVCGRHGGVGGAFLLAHLLLAEYGRLPRVVLKQTLAWDPLIDALLSRIPHAYIDPQPGDSGATTARVGELARGMAGDEALLIFPEGGNFTPRRRIRAIRRLRRRGLATAAARAERLRNVLPPHPDGLFAAIDAAPEADIVFVAHTGLDHLLSAADVWRALPLRVPVIFTWWAVPAAEVPRLEEARMTWLADHWARLDRWVAHHRVPS